MEQLQRCMHKGMLMKRCRLSWRPRYVELILDPGSATAGHMYSFQLILYDHRKHMIKNRISFDDVVTVRSCRDCNFQVFISDGKILQFRSESVESQAHWMAALKVGLGKGRIFHVRVHSACSLEHALLYSIGVNLPAHRVGQLDRVLVLASPINDINLNAWDLNRVKSFVESDVGIRMEICPFCIRGGQTDRITFIMERRFIDDCVQFLLREAHITTPPKVENGLKIHSISHRCGYIKPPDMPAPPPPYTQEEDTQEEDTQSKSTASLPRSTATNGFSQNGASFVFEQTSEINESAKFRSRTMGSIKPAYPLELWNDSTGSETGSSRAESLFLADGELTAPISNTVANDNDDFHSLLPPRTIPRTNYESSIPAKAQPYLKYQPHIYRGNKHFEAPYQISSRIIITDSGEVQFERNIMGNMPPQNQGGFLFKKQLPLPPRGVRAPTPQYPPPSSPGLSHRVKINMKSEIDFQAGQTAVPNPKAGGRFSKRPEKPRQDSPPPPPVPPHPPFNIKQERFLPSAPGGYMNHRPHHTQLTHVPPPAQILMNRMTPDVTAEQNTPASDFLTTPQTRLTQSTSDTGLASKATGFSITTFSRSNFLPHSSQAMIPKRFRSLKRTSSDSELSMYVGRGGSPFRNWATPSNKSSSMKRASQVSESSDIYIIPTPPSSAMSSRRSDSQVPISPSYVTESEFLGQTSGSSKPATSVPEDEDDSAFLPDDNESLYENGSLSLEQTRKVFQQKSQVSSSTDSYDDVIIINQQIEFDSSLPSAVSLTNSTSVYTNTQGSNNTMSGSNTQETQAAATKSASPKRLPYPVASPRTKKPAVLPRRSTLSSLNSETSELSLFSLGSDSPPNPLRKFTNKETSSGFSYPDNSYVFVERPGNGLDSFSLSQIDPNTSDSREQPVAPPTHTTLSPRRVTWKSDHEHIFSSTIPPNATHPDIDIHIEKTQSLPRKPPIPKPRKKQNNHLGRSLASSSHLSTSEGDLGEALSQSLELKDSRQRSRSTHTIMFNGEEVGVTDL